MIYIGYNNNEKLDLIPKEYDKYVYIYDKNVGINEDFNKLPNLTILEFMELIEYEVFYPMIQKLDTKTLIIVDECLKVRGKEELSFNCISNFVLKAGGIVSFNIVPFIETENDLMLLIMYENIKYKNSKNNKYSKDVLYDMRNNIKFSKNAKYNYTSIDVETTNDEIQAYTEERNKLFSELGQKHPDTVYNNLVLFAGKIKREKLLSVNMTTRNVYPRFMNTHDYNDNQLYPIVEVPLKRVILCNLMSKINVTDLTMYKTELKVDVWTNKNYSEWFKSIRELKDALSTIS